MEWEYVSLSEPRVVARLILHRGRMEAKLATDMDEPVRCTYIDLDRLIEHCGLDGRQEVTVTMLMLGYTSTDIAEMLSVEEWLIRQAFQRAVRKIVRQNNLVWKDTYS